MRLPWLSTSLSSGLDNCPYSAINSALNRVIYGNDYENTKFTEFGSVVHNVVETIHRHDMEGADPGDYVDLFDMYWRRTSLTDIDFYRFGKDNIRAFIERTLYERPGHTWAVELGFLTDIVNGGIFIFEEDTTQEDIAAHAEKIEKRGGVPYRSAIDRVDLEETEEGLNVYIYDYKTNFVPFTRDQVENSEQLALYHYAARQIWPDAREITVCYDMLRHGRFYHTFQEEDVRVIMDLAVNKWYQFVDTDEDQAPRLLNSYCGYCSFKDGCGVYVEALNGPVPPVLDPDIDDNLLELLYLLDQFKLRSKLLKQNIDAINKAIGDVIIDQNNGEPLLFVDDEGEDREVYLATNPRYEYDIKKVWPILSKGRALTLLKECATISRPGLELAVKGTKVEADVKEQLETKFVKPTLKVRKAK